MRLHAIHLLLTLALTAPAHAADKPTWLFFTSSTCGPCRQSVAIHKLPRVRAWMKRFKCVTVDVQQQPAIAKRYGVTRTPTDIFVSADKEPREYRPQGRPATENLYAWRFANAWRDFNWPHYPIRQGTLWTHPPDLTRHLSIYDDAQRLANINHTTEFDPAWVAWLPPLERSSLHSDHHENKVHWESVVRPSPQVAKR